MFCDRLGKIENYQQNYGQITRNTGFERKKQMIILYYQYLRDIICILSKRLQKL